MTIDISGVASLVSGDKINNGVWIALNGPTPGEDGEPAPLYFNGDTSKPVRALVRSNRCDAVRAAEQRLQRDGFVAVSRAKRKDRDRILAESSVLPEETRFSLWLVALENTGATEGRQDVSEGDAKAIYANAGLRWLVDQVRDAAYDDAKYLSDAERADLKAKEEAAAVEEDDLPQPVKAKTESAD